MASEFGYFLLPEESGELLQAGIEHCGLVGYRALSTSIGYELSRTEIKPAIIPKDREIYLVDKHASVKHVPELKGIIRVWLPFFIENRLCMATVGIAKPRDKSLLGIYKNSVPLYKCIVDWLKSHTHVGMIGVNNRTGAKDFYSDVAISKNAKARLEDDIVLKPFLGDTFVEFKCPDKI